MYPNVFHWSDVPRELIVPVHDLEHDLAFHRTAGLEIQQGFLEGRLPTLPASRALVARIMREYIPRESAGVEFGSGGYGTFFNLFLPDEFREKWTQYEINPFFVDHSKEIGRRYLGTEGRVLEGDLYKMPFADNSIDLMAVLSSYDSVMLFDKALAEVARCLRHGGDFVHFQDLIPAEMPLLLTELKKRQRAGLLEEVNYMCGYIPEFLLFSLESLAHEYEQIPSALYLTFHLADVGQQYGLVPLHSGIVQEEIVVTREIHAAPFRKLGVTYHDSFNSMGHLPGHNYSRENSLIRKRDVETYSGMGVIVAQKQ